ncbi:flavin reductase family protein [Streptomyces sp. NPDC007863]|uniref:flavin reductase family protein n=1 Tax=Streptomyces sp. NPDC007863 TaxID=3154894 RepID=UPI0033E4F14A
MTSAAVGRPSPRATTADPALHRTVRNFVTGVAVLTYGSAEAAEGITVSTLIVIPGDPPMVCVALRCGSRGLSSLLAASTFMANGLAAEHEYLARHFARRHRPRGLDQLPPEAWAEPRTCAAPRLRGAVSWLECRIVRTVGVGGHELVMARVLSGAAGSGAPLVNFAGALLAGPSCTPHTERKQ